MVRYAITIFVSAFLLFLVQPLIAKIILPWFGGTSAVWTTCIMFFQAALVLGYFYVHIVRRWLKPRAALIIHAVLLAGAAFTLPLTPTFDDSLIGLKNLTWDVVIVLALKVGLPFFALSTTGPLIQAWQASTHPERSPYRLYSLSNLGSFVALLGYPFAIEPLVGIKIQSAWWTGGYVVFVLFCLLSGWQTFRLKTWRVSESAESTLEAPASPGVFQVATWLLLSMTASVMLLATTNALTQEVAAYPFLWILPLSLYLLTFIICFENPRWYKRRVFVPLLLFFGVFAILLMEMGVFASLMLHMIGLGGVCFASAMICHGELERMKPPPEHLTLFYLLLSVGGLLGGVFVVVIAPQLFNRFHEFHLGLLVALMFPATMHLMVSYRNQSHLDMKSIAWFLGALAVSGVVGTSLYNHLSGMNQHGFIFCDRNEYGIVAVTEDKNYREIVNGQIGHGRQYLDEELSRQPVGYYNAESGAGIAFTSIRKYLSQKAGQDNVPIKVGIIGLGSGCLTTWLVDGDWVRFYEINPLVEDVAREYFTYLSATKAEVEVVIGDARVQLQRELETHGSHDFDMLFVDAFSSDSIPIHLLTQECKQLYLKHLSPDGLLVMHVSNRYLSLYPVVAEYSADSTYKSTLFEQVSENEHQNSCKWVIMTRNEEIYGSEAFLKQKSDWPPGLKTLNWTDDFASVASLLDFSIWIDVNAMTQEQQRRANATADPTDH